MKSVNLSLALTCTQNAECITKTKIVKEKGVHSQHLCMMHTLIAKPLGKVSNYGA